MHKIIVIAAREYQAAVRTKSFIISLLILPLMMGGSVLIQLLLKDKVDIKEKRFAVIDRTPDKHLLGVIEKAAKQRNEKQIFDAQTKAQVQPVFTIEAIPPSAGDSEAINRQRFEQSERVRKQEIFGFLEIGADVTRYEVKKVATGETSPTGNSPPSEPSDQTVLRYQSNSPTSTAFQEWVHRVVNDEIRAKRFEALKLSGDKWKPLLQDVRVLAKGLSVRTIGPGKAGSEAGEAPGGIIQDAPDQNPIASIAVAGGLLMMMFMMVLLGSTPLMNGVIEEKMQRIAEVLLGSVRPFELMMGKLVGMVGVSLTLAGIYLGGAYWAAHHYELSHYLSRELLAWFVTYLALAVVMYGSLFVAIGAACTDVRETQAMVWPVMLLICVPMFVWLNVVREPTSAFAQGMSLFPFATPMLMIARLAVPPGIPVWQPILGVVLVLLTTAFCVYVAGRIFRVGLLMQGKGAHIGDLVRWVVRG
jgi:ABC-2 type transport system permease protein